MTTTDQTIATLQFFDAGIDEIQQSSLTGTHWLCQLQLQFHHINLNRKLRHCYYLIKYISYNTPRVRSRSEAHRARPGGSSRTSGVPMMTAGSLSAAADGLPEANPIARRRRGHKTPDNVVSHPLWRTARHFGPFPASQ